LFNQAQQQNTSNALAQGNFANNAQNQTFQQGLANSNLFNQAQQQNTSNALAQGNFANNAQNQQFNQDLANANLNNTNQQTQFNQGLANANLTNGLQNQQFNQGLAATNLNNTAQGQQFNQNLAATAMGNSAANQTFSNALAGAQFTNNAATQQQTANQNAQGFNQNLYQQQLANSTAQQYAPLNAMNSLLSGQQVQNPIMPTFNQAGVSQTPNLMGAAQATYGANMDAFNAQQAQNNSFMNGLFSLGGSAASLFSDRALKRDIVHIANVDGVRVYEYQYIWGGPRQRGVMADEVPHAAFMDESGFFKVDYSKVWK
jgi:hypothetical protein